MCLGLSLASKIKQDLNRMSAANNTVSIRKENLDPRAFETGTLCRFQNASHSLKA